ncbi:hypothetical protein MLPF_1294 [Mycobacterium lepromatosis]|nr:hypothetical protein MLPF_1294 [Mycobacterium lepromatosis]
MTLVQVISDSDVVDARLLTDYAELIGVELTKCGDYF